MADNDRLWVLNWQTLIFMKVCQRPPLTDTLGNWFRARQNYSNVQTAKTFLLRGNVDYINDSTWPCWDWPPIAPSECSTPFRNLNEHYRGCPPVPSCPGLFPQDQLIFKMPHQARSALPLPPVNTPSPLFEPQAGLSYNMVARLRMSGGRVMWAPLGRPLTWKKKIWPKQSLPPSLPPSLPLSPAPPSACGPAAAPCTRRSRPDDLTVAAKHDRPWRGGGGGEGRESGGERTSTKASGIGRGLMRGESRALRRPLAAGLSRDTGR